MSDLERVPVNFSAPRANKSLIDVGEELAVIGTWPTRLASLVSIVDNLLLVLIFLHASGEGRQLKHRAKFLILAISDLLFSLYFFVVGLWTLFVTDQNSLSGRGYLGLQLYAILNICINRLLSLEIAGQRAWIITCGTQKQRDFLAKTTKDVVKDVIKRVIIPGFLLGATLCGIVYQGLRNMERGIPPPGWYFLLHAVGLSGIVVAMASIAAYILVKSRDTFQGKPTVIEFQHSVAAVAIVFCVCNVPCSVVYWWRAIILPHSLSGVSTLARQFQAFFHLVNSGSNFFIYYSISARFRQSAQRLWRRVTPFSDRRYETPAKQNSDRRNETSATQSSER